MSASTEEEVDDDEFNSQLQAMERLDAIIERISKRAQPYAHTLNRSDQTKHDRNISATDNDATFLTSFDTSTNGNALSDSRADVERMIAETVESTSAASEADSPSADALNGFSFAADDADRLSEIDRLLGAIAAADAKSKRSNRSVKRPQKHSKTPQRNGVKLPRIGRSIQQNSAVKHSTSATAVASPVDDEVTDNEYREKLKSLEQRLQTARDADDEKDGGCSDPRLMYNKVLALTEMDYSPYTNAAAPLTTFIGSDSDDDAEWTLDDERQCEIDSIIPDSDDDDDDDDDDGDDGGRGRVVLKVSLLGSKIERMLGEMDATAAAAGITPNRSLLPERAATGEAALANRSRRLSEPQLLRPSSAGTKTLSVISSSALDMRT